MKKAPPTLQTIPKTVRLVIALAVVVAIVFLQPYFGPIFFSILIAFLFDPVYKWIHKRLKFQGVAIGLTIVIAFISIVVPIILVVGVSVTEAQQFASDIKSGQVNVDSTVTTGSQRVKDFLNAFPGDPVMQVDPQKVNAAVKQFAADFIQGITVIILSAGVALTHFFTTLILSIFLISALLRNQSSFLQNIKNLSPFEAPVLDTYFRRAGLMTNAMVKGQLIIAVAQGFASAFSLWIVGIGYFWFFFVFLTFLCFIPLGGGIVTNLVAFILILTGNVWAGVFIILFQYVVVSNIDNILRPKLVPPEAMINPALIVLSVFCGLAIFGGLGVVFGPVLMILLITTFQMYGEFNKRAKKIALPQPEKAVVKT